MTAKSISSFLNVKAREKTSYVKPYENQQRESSSNKGGWDGILFHAEKDMKCYFAELGVKI